MCERWKSKPPPETQTIKTAHRFRFLEQKKEKVLCHFGGGIVAEHDAVIGADGIRSKVRQNLFGDSEPTFCGYKIWRGYRYTTNRSALNALRTYSKKGV